VIAACKAAVEPVHPSTKSLSLSVRKIPVRVLSPFEADDVQNSTFDVHLGQHQAARFGNPQAMLAYQQQQAAVAGPVAAALDSGHELIDLGGSEMFAVVHHFVYCWGVGAAREAAPLLRRVF
jgi:hypothetical protein